MGNEVSFGPLLLVLFLAFLVPILLSRFNRLRLPIIVGEILAGMIVGDSGLHWVSGNDQVLELLSGFGFVFLMFLSGMEIDFSSLGGMVAPRRNRGVGNENAGGVPEKTKNQAGLSKLQSPLMLGALCFSITLLLSVGVGFGLLMAGLSRNPWMMALILSTTSLGVVLPVLKERGLTLGHYGQTLLVSALIADFATMLLITVLVAKLSIGLTFNILLIGLLFVAFFFIYRLGNYFFSRLPVVRMAMEELNHATAQIKMRAAFMLMFVFVVLSSALGAEVILGAFMAGAILSLLREPQDENLVSQLESIGFGFFIPIFFIKVGIDFNLQALVSSPRGLALVPILLLAAIGIKMLSALVFRLAFPWRDTLAAGAMLSARLSLIIAASAIGLRMGIISETINSAIVLVAIITVTGAPLLFLRIIPDQAGVKNQPILIYGAGELGMLVAKELLVHKERAILVDPDPARIGNAHQKNLEAIASSLESPSAELVDILDQTKAFVCTVNNTNDNYGACYQSHTVFGIDHIVAYVSEPNEMERFRLLGVTPISPALDRSIMLAHVARSPAIYDLLYKQHQESEFSEIEIKSRWCSNKTLREIRFPGDVLVISLHRDGEMVIPHGDTRLDCGDHLTIMGSAEHVQEARQLLESD